MWARLFPAKINLIVQKVILLFLEKEDEIERWFWRIWIAQWREFFRTTVYFLRFWPSLGENGEGDFELVPFLIKNSNPSEIFQTMLLFFLLEYYR